MMKTDKPLPDSVLFVCMLNSIRSPMAEGIMKSKFGDEVYVQSCGLEAGELNDLMVAVMKEKKLDMSAHRSRTISELSDTSFDILICFTEDAMNAVSAVFDGSDTDIEYWPIPDPTAGAADVRAMMENYRSVRDAISMRIDRKFS